MVRIRAADRTIWAEMKDLAHVDTGGDDRITSSCYVRDDQVSSLCRTGRGGRQSLAELDRARGTVRRELKYAGAGRRHILPPLESSVELLGAVNIRDRNYNNLKFHVDCRALRLVVPDIADCTRRTYHLRSLLRIQLIRLCRLMWGRPSVFRK